MDIQARRLAYVSMSALDMRAIYPELMVPVLAIGGLGLTDDILPYYSAIHSRIKLPDDIHIVALHYHSTMQAWYLVVSGEGLPVHSASMPHYVVEYALSHHVATVTRMVCTCK